jgi:hypothetical protein
MNDINRAVRIIETAETCPLSPNVADRYPVSARVRVYSRVPFQLVPLSLLDAIIKPPHNLFHTYALAYTSQGRLNLSAAMDPWVLLRL